MNFVAPDKVDREFRLTDKDGTGLICWLVFGAAESESSVTKMPVVSPQQFDRLIDRLIEIRFEAERAWSQFERYWKMAGGELRAGDGEGSGSGSPLASFESQARRLAGEVLSRMQGEVSDLDGVA